MTMPNHDQQGLRPHAEVLREYRRDWPLLDAYRRVIEENNGHDGPITEPHSAHGVDNVTAAARALVEIGRPADRMSAMMALAFIKHLETEIGTLSAPEPPTISSTLIGYFFQFSDHIPDVEAWEAQSEDEQRYLIDELADQVPGEVLPEILRLAMPALLQHVIDEDRRHRNPLHVVKPQPTTETADPWDSARLATAALGTTGGDDTA